MCKVGLNRMKFEQKINMEIKLIGLAMTMLGIFCAYHQITMVR